MSGSGVALTGSRWRSREQTGASLVARVPAFKMSRAGVPARVMH